MLYVTISRSSPIGARALALAVAALTAACTGSPSGSSLPPSGGSAAHPQMKVTAAYCAAHPLIDFKMPQLRARSHKDVALSACGIRGVSRGIGAAAPPSRLRAAGSSLTVFDVPGAITAGNCASYELFNDCGTLGLTINAPGAIVGYYLDSSAVITAFARTQSGNYTTFEAPGAGLTPYFEQGTIANEINNGGVSAGLYTDPGYVFHGFVRQKDGSFLTYDTPWDGQIPNANFPQGTNAANINAGGDTAGIYWDTQGVNHGFIRYSNGSFVQVIPTGSLRSSVCIGSCLNNGGAVDGAYTDSGGVHGLLRSAAGSITTIDGPGAVFTVCLGINNGNAVTCAFGDSNNVTWSLIRRSNGKTIVFQDPNASQTSGNGTEAQAINDAGAVTGFYGDASGVPHGFYRSQTGQFSEFDPSGSVGTFPTDINANGTVTGYWFDSLGQVHGLIWTPHE